MAKKILIIRNAYDYDFGGGERFPVELATELCDHNYSPILISRNPKLLKLSKERGLATIRGPWLSNQDFSGKRITLFPLYILWQLFLFIWYWLVIAFHQPKVVHPQSRDDFIAATLAGRLWFKKVVWTDHADLKYILRNHTVWFKNPVGKLVWHASKLASYITLVSRSEKHLIEERVGDKLSKKFTVIHNGVKDISVSPTARKNEDKNSIIFVATSRLVTTKGVGELIKAFSQLEGNVRLWLLGEGPEEARFKKVAEGNNKISFLGFPDDALSHVKSADVFVHPSYHEGFSISLVEAASLGKPIIACSVGGNPEIVKNEVNGLLVPPQDIVSLFGAMNKLATDKRLRLKYGKEARLTYEESFVFEKIVLESFLPLYD